MNEHSSLTALAGFAPRSPLMAEDERARQTALASLAESLGPSRSARRRVSDLLLTVLTLSARTRRMVMPTAAVELDVFSPGGSRALRIFLPERGA